MVAAVMVVGVVAVAVVGFVVVGRKGEVGSAEDAGAFVDVITIVVSHVPHRTGHVTCISTATLGPPKAVNGLHCAAPRVDSIVVHVGWSLHLYVVASVAVDVSGRSDAGLTVVVEWSETTVVVVAAVLLVAVT